MRPPDGVSIIIPSRADVLGLWATVTACEVLLSGSPHQFIAVVNGQELQEGHQLLQERSGVEIVCDLRPLPPPIARNEGAKLAKYQTLCFLDDHVLPTREFFDWDLYAAAVVHGSYKTYPNHPLRYFHFKFNPECPTKGDYSTSAENLTPYPCLSGPHGGFFVDKKYWESSGGYDDFWQGFGGEEAYFGLKAKLRGEIVLCNPNALFYHFSCRSRGYSKQFNEFNFTEGLKRLPSGLNGLLSRFDRHKL